MTARNKIIITLSVLMLIGLTYSLYFYKANRRIFKVERGDGLLTIASQLDDDNIVISQTLFKIVYTLMSDKSTNIAYGQYDFTDRYYNIIDVARKFASGKADQPGTLVLIPEGFTNMEIARRLSVTHGINTDAFYKYAKKYEGMLFPETYFFEKGVSKEAVVEKMLGEYKRRVGELEQDTLVLASIIEGEAKHKEDMHIISGILKNRLKIGMPLQVDVAPITYKEKGIPVKAINNPGLNAINAAKNGNKTDYYYYITGNDGKMHYAKTFDVHKENIRKYLR